jgi:hypothetical protein
LHAAASVFVLKQCSCSIFSILDDECNVPKGSDDNIAPAIGQLALRLSTGVHWSKDKPLLSVAKIGHDKFSVAHYAGDVRDVCVCAASKRLVHWCLAGAIHNRTLARQESRRFEY